MVSVTQGLRDRSIGERIGPYFSRKAGEAQGTISKSQILIAWSSVAFRQPMRKADVVAALDDVGDAVQDIELDVDSRRGGKKSIPHESRLGYNCCMFTLRDRRTGELFDRWSYFGDKRRRLMEQSWAGVFRNHLLVELPVDALCRHLDERMGRPSKDLHVVIGVLLLQQLHDLSDAETVEALAFNMAWHYALDVRSEADSYFCEKTLRNYRRLFIEQGLDELLFRCLTDRMVQGFSVDTSHQRMDSTALRSAMRALTRLGIVVESISKFARELERYHPGLHEQISKEVIRRYVDREGNGAFANTAPSVSKRRLGEAGQDLLALVLQFRDTAAAKLSSFAILERVLRDQFEIVDDECGDRDAKRAAIRDPKDVPCDTVGNPADPDASYNAHKGQGYMAQIVETYCEDDSNEAVAATPDLITHVEVHKMTVHDGHRLADALDDLSERALTPAVMLGDSHYGSSDNMALTREQNINLVAPARPPKGAVSGRLTLEDFTLNEEGLVLRCPNNVEPVSASLAKAKLQARFDLSICQKCPDILRCPVQAAKRDGQFSRFQYTPARAANQKRRLYEQSDAFRDVYRWRGRHRSDHVAIKVPDEPGSPTHSRHAGHALRGQSACPRPQYPTLRGNRTIKNEAKEKPRIGNIRFYPPATRRQANILHRTAKTCTSTPSANNFLPPRRPSHSAPANGCS